MTLQQRSNGSRVMLHTQRLELLAVQPLQLQGQGQLRLQQLLQARLVFWHISR